MAKNYVGSSLHQAIVNFANPLTGTGSLQAPGKVPGNLQENHINVTHTGGTGGIINVTLNSNSSGGDIAYFKNMPWVNVLESQKIYVSNLVMGAGNDYASLERSAAEFVNMGAGNDTLEANGSYVKSANLGDGDDTAIVGLGDGLTLSESEVAQKNSSYYEIGQWDGGAGTNNLSLLGEWTLTLSEGMFLLDTDGDGLWDLPTSILVHSQLSMIIIMPPNLHGTVQFPDTYGIQNKIIFTNFQKINGVCFTDGTLVETDTGPRAIETLREGDTIITNQGPKILKWFGKKVLDIVDLAANPNLMPVRIPAHSFGNGVPYRDISFSPQHRVALRSKLSEKMFGEQNVLMACKHLIGVNGIDIDHDVEQVTYYHLLFDEHCTINVEGIEAETLYRGKLALSYLSKESLNELRKLFDDIDAILTGETVAESCAFMLTARQAKALSARHRKQKHLELYR